MNLMGKPLKVLTHSFKNHLFVDCGPEGMANAESHWLSDVKIRAVDT